MQQPGDERPEVVFARRMREVRESKGRSQSAVAMHLMLVMGVRLDATAITRMEKGTRGIGLDEAVGIADALGTTVTDLLRPAAIPFEEQLESVRREGRDAHMRWAAALAEYQGARWRERTLEEVLAEELAKSYGGTRGDNDGEHPEAD